MWISFALAAQGKLFNITNRYFQKGGPPVTSTFLHPQLFATREQPREATLMVLNGSQDSFKRGFFYYI